MHLEKIGKSYKAIKQDRGQTTEDMQKFAEPEDQKNKRWIRCLKVKKKKTLRKKAEGHIDSWRKSRAEESSILTTEWEKYS